MILQQNGLQFCNYRLLSTGKLPKTAYSLESPNGAKRVIFCGSKPMTYDVTYFRRDAKLQCSSLHNSLYRGGLEIKNGAILDRKNTNVGDYIFIDIQ